MGWHYPWRHNVVMFCLKFQHRATNHYHLESNLTVRSLEKAALSKVLNTERQIKFWPICDYRYAIYQQKQMIFKATTSTSRFWICECSFLYLANLSTIALVLILECLAIHVHIMLSRFSSVLRFLWYTNSNLAKSHLKAYTLEKTFAKF